MRPTRDTGVETPIGSTPGNSRPGSVEGTPEEGQSSRRMCGPQADVAIDEARHVTIPVERVIATDGPFVLADPTTMDMPVFSKPIVAPKMILSQFPKVTPYFLPNNGGDAGPFPRREKTRSWKDSERQFVGIGGGTLKFKSWVKGESYFLRSMDIALIPQARRAISRMCSKRRKMSRRLGQRQTRRQRIRNQKATRKRRRTEQRSSQRRSKKRTNQRQNLQKTIRDLNNLGL